MHASVPQYIDIEDHIAFGLTAKQLLWLGGGLVALFALYTLVDRDLFFILAVVVALIFGALAFFRPQGVSLLVFLGFIFLFFTKPRSYVWKRIFENRSASAKKAHDFLHKQMEPPRPEKKLPNQGQLRKIAWILDTKK